MAWQASKGIKASILETRKKSLKTFTNALISTISRWVKTYFHKWTPNKENEVPLETGRQENKIDTLFGQNRAKRKELWPIKVGCHYSPIGQCLFPLVNGSKWQASLWWGIILGIGFQPDWCVYTDDEWIWPDWGCLPFCIFELKRRRRRMWK